MSLEQKIEELGEKIDALTAVLSGAKVTVNNVVKTDDGDGEDDDAKGKKAKGKKADKPAKTEKKAKKAAKDDDDDLDGDDDGDGDDFADDDGGDDDGDEPSADDIRNLLMKVKDKKGAEAARGILSEIGVRAIAQIPADKYGKVVKFAKKLGVSP